MRLPKFLGALVVPLALTIAFFSLPSRAANAGLAAKVAKAAYAASQASAIKSLNFTKEATQGRHAITYEQAKAMDTQIHWWRFNPNVNHKCLLTVSAFDTWKENGQVRYRVIAQANPGSLPDQMKRANPAEWGDIDDVLLRSWFEKDMLSTWKKAFHLANDNNPKHPGQNPQAFFEYKQKSGHWVMYGDLSLYIDLVKKGSKDGQKGRYIKINVDATKLWEDWTLNRCSVMKDF